MTSAQACGHRGPVASHAGTLAAATSRVVDQAQDGVTGPACLAALVVHLGSPSAARFTAGTTSVDAGSSTP
jgi:hypothetical protein